MNYEFNLWQDGILVASGECDVYDRLVLEALRYASTYSEDSDNLKLTIGPKKKRTPKPPNVSNKALDGGEKGK